MEWWEEIQPSFLLGARFLAAGEGNEEMQDEWNGEVAGATRVGCGTSTTFEFYEKLQLVRGRGGAGAGMLKTKEWL